MTPAINLLTQQRIAHQVLSYPHEPGAASYGLEAVEKLGLDAAAVFKTLLAANEKGELLVAIVPVAGQLDLKALARNAKWPSVRRHSARPVTWSAGSARWGRRSACAPLSMPAPWPWPGCTSAPAGVGWRWPWPQPTWCV